MIAIVPHAEGTVVRIRAQPGARRAGIVGEWNGALKIAVTEPPQDGRANQALAGVLRRAFGLRRAQVQLVRGLASRDKAFLLRGLTPAELAARLPPLDA